VEKTIQGLTDSVAKSTHAGIPWLHHLHRNLHGRIHIWPFDGWNITRGRSAMVEVYPSLWHHGFPGDNRTPDQRDAYTIAAWLRQVDSDGKLSDFLNPSLLPAEKTIAQVEGWILGVM
jgi:hypothetical protein